MRARRLRMPVIRPVCLDLDETTKNTGTTTTRTVAAGSVETRVTTTWTHGMTNGAETYVAKESAVSRAASQTC